MDSELKYQIEYLQGKLATAQKRESALIGEFDKLVEAVNYVDRAIASPMFCGDDVTRAFYRLVDVMKTCKALFEKPITNGFYNLLQAHQEKSKNWADKFFTEQNKRWELERQIEAINGSDDQGEPSAHAPRKTPTDSEPSQNG